MNLLRRHPQPFVLVARLTLGGLFLASSLPKLRQPYDFLANIYQYQLTGPLTSKLIAMVLPWLELFIAVGLLGGIIVGGCLLWTIGLVMVFGFAQGAALIRELPIACGCFGSLTSASETVSYVSLLRLGFMFLIAVLGLVAWVYQDRMETIPPSRRKRANDEVIHESPATCL